MRKTLMAVMLAAPLMALSLVASAADPVVGTVAKTGNATWTTGQFVQIGIAGVSGEVYWNGTNWVENTNIKFTHYWNGSSFTFFLTMYYHTSYQLTSM